MIHSKKWSYIYFLEFKPCLALIDILLNEIYIYMPFVIFLYLPLPIFYSCHIFTFPSVLIFKPLRFKQKISAQILSNICSGKCFEVQCAFSPVLILSKQREIKSSSQMDSIKEIMPILLSAYGVLRP